MAVGPLSLLVRGSWGMIAFPQVFREMPGFSLNKVYAPENGVFLLALTGNTFSWSRLSRH